MLKNALHLLELGAVLVLALAAAGLISGCARRSLPDKAESSAAKSCTVTLSPNDSIQQAIDTASSGAVICLGEGTWEENLVIGKSLTLRGAGAEKTVIKSAEEGRPVVVIEGDEIEVALEGVTITGAFRSCSGLSGRCPHGLVAKRSARVSLQNSKVFGNENDGLSVWDSAQVSLQGSTVSDNRLNGLMVEEAARVSLQGSTVSDNGWNGLWVGTSAQVSMQDCTVSGNGADGLFMYDSAQVILQGSTVSDNGGGLLVENSAKVILEECTVSDNEGNGLLVWHKAHVELTNTTICNNTYWGIAAWLKKCGTDVDDFEGTVLWKGRGNEIYDNGEGDVCLP